MLCLPNEITIIDFNDRLVRNIPKEEIVVSVPICLFRSYISVNFTFPETNKKYLFYSLMFNFVNIFLGFQG